jgi:hypothetical protein
MRKPKMAKTSLDNPIAELIQETDKKILALWARDCAERVMPYFEDKYPNDKRPRQAIEALQDWIDTGVFSMKVIRKASLDSHAAARDLSDDKPAHDAARAAGQAVATTHVKEHAQAAAIYAATAIRDASEESQSEAATLQEREWQYQHLLELRET